MKKFSKRGVLLFAAATAVCAFAMPSLASASSWGVIGSEHTLHSPNLGFIGHGAIPLTSACSVTSFTTDVRNADSLTITSATFGGCTATGVAGGIIGDCTMTAVATSLPWSATANSAGDIRILGVRIAERFEQLPGSSACNAVVNGQNFTITGSLTGGSWTGNGANQHEVVFSNGSGLVSHSGLGLNTPLTVSGTIRDTQQSLTVNG